jgi:hypothetical protein
MKKKRRIRKVAYIVRVQLEGRQRSFADSVGIGGVEVGNRIFGARFSKRRDKSKEWLGKAREQKQQDG